MNTLDTDDLALERAVADLQSRLRKGEDLEIALSKIAQGHRVNREELKLNYSEAYLFEPLMEEDRDYLGESYRHSEADDLDHWLDDPVDLSYGDSYYDDRYDY